MMTLIARGTRDRVRASAHSCLTGIALSTSVAVITRGAIYLVWIRARSRLRITRAGVVTLIARGARHWIGANANSGLASVCLSASVAIVAGGAVGLHGIRAGSRLRIEHTGIVTLVA